MGEPAIVLFDGLCNLCNGSVRFILRNDPAGRFKFASLQSEEARRALAAAGRAAGNPESIVLIENGRAYDRSDAALRIATSLQWPWPALGALFAIPARRRDAVYHWIAKNRYRWFGKREACDIPTPQEQAQFL